VLGLSFDEHLFVRVNFLLDEGVNFYSVDILDRTLLIHQLEKAVLL
jgi:hypothetical protein